MADLTTSANVDTMMGSADNAAIRTNIGLGTIATQAASAVAITGGTVTGTRISLRTVTVADAISITPAGDTTDVCYQLNTQATGTLTINAPTGTPQEGDTLVIKLKATNVQTFSWNAIYRGGTDIALPTVSTAAKIDRIGFQYDSVGAKWDVISLARGY